MLETLRSEILFILGASNFKIFSRSLEQFFLTVGQKNFANKIPFLSKTPPLRLN